MKKLLILGLVLVLVALPVLASCNNNDNPPVDSSTPATNAEPSTSEPETTEPVTEPVTRDEPTVSGDYTYNLVNSQAILIAYSGNASDLVIPEKIDGFAVTGIDKMLFAYNTAITSLTLPGSLKETGELAFFHCDNLKTVTLGEGIETISRACFNSCEALETVNRPASLKTIGEIAFQGCTALKSIDLSGVTAIGYRAFANAGLTAVTVPASCTGLSSAAFFACTELVSADVQVPIETFPSNLFAYCYALKDVKIAEGTRRIDEDCFFRCLGLETLTLPTSCIKIGSRSLYGCTALKTIYILTTEKFYVDYFAAEFVPALETIYYAGTEDTHGTWSIDRFNYYFTEAAVVCNYTK
ncbi:MAG: leucine-rich repeat protein [Clostridia bacterium]|nr:leucine-rich repeat protein [Clostridia bacterium]